MEKTIAKLAFAVFLFSLFCTTLSSVGIAYFVLVSSGNKVAPHYIKAKLAIIDFLNSSSSQEDKSMDLSRFYQGQDLSKGI